VINIFKRNDIDYEFLPDTIEAVETPASPLGNFFIFFISFLICAVIGICFLGKVDKVIEGHGKVIPNGDIKTIQAVSSGKIKEINVKEGDRVEAGKVLVQLDSSDNDLELANYQTQLANLKVELRILENDRDGVWNDEGIDFTNVSEKIKASYEEYKKTKSQVDGNRNESNQRKINDAQDKINDAEKEATEAKNKLDAAANTPNNETQKQYLQTQYNDKLSSVEDYKKQLDSLQKQIEAEETSRKSSTIEQILTKEKDIQNIEFKINEIKNQKTKSEIVSPVAGYISTLNYNTLGVPVIMDKSVATIIPDDTEMIVEAYVNNRDISEITEGQKVALKFEAYSYQKYGAVDGVVDYISNNAIQDEKQGGVYKVNIKLDKQYIEAGGSQFKIMPGMNVSVELLCGKRRIIDFFLEPFNNAVEKTFSR